MSGFLDAYSAFILYEVFVVITEIILVPFLCYLLFNFWKYRKLEFIHRRRPLLTVVLVVCTILQFSIYIYGTYKYKPIHTQIKIFKKKVILPICAYKLMFGANSFEQKLYKWIGLSALIHEALLVPRFWFLYFDWQLGMDLSKLEWTRQLYLGRLYEKERVVALISSSMSSSSSSRPPLQSIKKTDVGVAGAGIDASTITDANGNAGANTDLNIIEEESLGVVLQKKTVMQNKILEPKVEHETDLKKVLVVENSVVNPFTKVETLRWTLRYRYFLGNTQIVLAIVVIYFLIYLGGAALIHFFESVLDAVSFVIVYVAFTDVVLLVCACKITGCCDLLEIQSFFFCKCPPP
ncbi:hypothetical protein RFI_20025 [Reticulomyxa filosa]|uniref:Uncharacterized protein n=1 Tax=Reticulomyxa filosa TaxID=46433 RepID=X6MW20_RETFI|nr:hypothetical protein RFI_20025 [Reticulomyxa filosa]|eukprot:ETO17300.1 hypothetical protein RFI_20025 [Reticulomyxa filosa]